MKRKKAIECFRLLVMCKNNILNKTSKKLLILFSLVHFKQRTCFGYTGTKLKEGVRMIKYVARKSIERKDFHGN